MLVKKFHPEARLPRYQTPGASGMDLHASDSGFVAPGEQRKVGTDIAVAVPKGYEGQIRPRSGFALQGITCHLGTIDCDYRGEVCVVLMNVGRKGFYYKQGDRIAQLVIAPVKKVSIKEVDELDPTKRGKGGFGSTGK